LNTRQLALNLLLQAEKRLKTAQREARHGSPAYAIRSAQECVELCLKGALRFIGVEYPKQHDVGEVLLAVGDRLPVWFGVEEKAKISHWLAERREPAMYGDEIRGKGANQLFTREEALLALKYARDVSRDCRRLMRQPAVQHRPHQKRPIS